MGSRERRTKSEERKKKRNWGAIIFNDKLRANGVRLLLYQVIPKGPNPFGLSRRWRSLCEADSLYSQLYYICPIPSGALRERQAQGERCKSYPIAVTRNNLNPFPLSFLFA